MSKEIDDKICKLYNVNNINSVSKEQMKKDIISYNDKLKDAGKIINEMIFLIFCENSNHRFFNDFTEHDLNELRKRKLK